MKEIYVNIGVVSHNIKNEVGNFLNPFEVSSSFQYMDGYKKNDRRKKNGLQGPKKKKGD